MLILQVLLAVGGPALEIGLKLIPIFYQYRLLKTEAEVREMERRFKVAIAEAEAKASDPTRIRDQYQDAKKAAKDAWNKLNSTK